MKTVAIYVGRFQPFHKGHQSAYKHLVDKFGEENVFVGTTDPKEITEKNPFDFSEKKQIMNSLFDIPSERVVQVKNPYRPEEILTKFDPRTTTFVTAVGEKDAGRLQHGKYFRQYQGDDSNLPYKDAGYFVTIPNFKVDDTVMSATKIRDTLGNPAVSVDDKVDFFKKVYGEFNPKLFNMMTNAMGDTAGQTMPGTAQPEDSTGTGGDPSVLMKKVHNPHTRRDILVKTALSYDKTHPAYKLAKKMFQSGKMHEIFPAVLVENALINQYNSLVDQFITGEERRTDCRIDPTDSYDEIERKCKNAYKNGVFYYPLVYALRSSTDDDHDEEPTEEPVQEAESSTERVRKYYKKHPEKVRKYLKKTQNDRVKRNGDRAKAVKKHGKSKMKNHDVHHPDGVNGSWQLAKKDHGRDKKKVNEGLILEGGASGHMMHPYEDLDLTFGQYKDMISRGLIGSLGDEGPVTEKLDGQNIAFSVINGDIRFARNKGHVKNGGANSMTSRDVMKKFEGRGDIQTAFVGASRDLEAAIRSLPDDQMEQIFANGKKYMSVEIILPDTTNVIPYNKSVLVFHGTIEYDEQGNKVAGNVDDAKVFSDQLTKVGQHQQKVFGMQGPHVINFNDKDIDKMKDKTQQYHSTIDQLSQTYGLNDDDPVSEYYKRWWTDEIGREAEANGIQLDDMSLQGLVNRFAFNDKTTKLRDFKDPKVRSWLGKYQKEVLPQVQKKARRPFEMVFLKVGADSLKRIENFLAVNNPGAVEDLKRELDTVKQSLRGRDLGDVAKKLDMEFERLAQIGVDNIVPSEGLVFMYNGAPYKFTGAFAPINQILGTFKFGMPDAPQQVDPRKPQQAEPDRPQQQAPSDDIEQDKEFIKQYYGQKIKNPETGKDVTIQSALSYDKNHPVYTLALQFLSSRMNK